ncbi:4'-phosphopantetheinyl transferase family protein [Pontibacter silvestris]|uniref:Enterobactin synthase component D n=1 Tax=Pontibacter silvestris TaxID=2305183 RepID=A0ABW4X4C2_9BACT|nr:4'-phosphopantetheinyl transferase superfamily protein [Pontibacter silvestris]MCC9137905.1 4'-phosphopantetheinyl transferase superfamily protein [Pontibacter silvestris]
MPLLETRPLSHHTLLGIWELTEEPDQLLPLLPSHLKIATEVLSKVHHRRQKEWLASRVLAYRLLQHFTNAPLLLQKDDNNRPYFSDHRFHLSITHSPKLAAVIVSDKHEVGIDIELISPKALRVADKFLSKAESEFTGRDETSTCLFWSAKETLYKMYSRRKLTLKENLFIKPAEEANVLLGRVQTENYLKLYRISYETILNHILTYTVDNHSYPLQTNYTSI